MDGTRSRRRFVRTGLVGAVASLSGCIATVRNLAQEWVFPEERRELVRRYEVGVERFERAHDHAASAVDEIEADNWAGARADLESGRTLAAESAAEFEAAYELSRKIAATEAQRKIASSWTKSLELRRFAARALVAMSYAEEDEPDQAEQWMESEAWGHWNEVREHRLAPVSEIREALEG